MKAKEKVVYVPPVYEEVQHEVTSVDDNNVPLRTSFHTDVSLLQRIDNMRVDAQTLREIKLVLLLHNLIIPFIGLIGIMFTE